MFTENKLKCQNDVGFLRPRIDFKEQRLVLGRVPLRADGCIDVKGVLLLLKTVARVYVSADVDRRLDGADSLAELRITDRDHLTGIGKVRAFVEHSVDRTVRDEHVGILRDLRPMTAQRLTSRHIERPVKELGLNGRTPELHALDLAAGVQKVMETLGLGNDAVFEQVLRRTEPRPAEVWMVFVHADVMVSQIGRAHV